MEYHQFFPSVRFFLQLLFSDLFHYIDSAFIFYNFCTMHSLSHYFQYWRYCIKTTVSKFFYSYSLNLTAKVYHHNDSTVGKFCALFYHIWTFSVCEETSFFYNDIWEYKISQELSCWSKCPHSMTCHSIWLIL